MLYCFFIFSAAAVSVGALQARVPGESTADVRVRVELARAIQRARMESREVTAATNGTLSQRDVERIAPLCDAGSRLLATAVTKLALSVRAYGKILRVARTIADLEGSVAISPAHIAEAIGTRVLDRSSVSASAA